MLLHCSKMQAESQISLNSNVRIHPGTISLPAGEPGVSSSIANTVMLQQPAQKKPTRQWAAWTRQEEERFFTALRQVGKNFEKITCRVQSKNKDQVRHYYYRLVRRMNKLLGPRLCLDAKNSKDTNAAMLRWWSLLEKYSCKASKLHLKPRRFKIFVETLEHQLLKDRQKNVKKRALMGENCPPATPSTVLNQSQSRASGSDARTVKLVLVDSQNIQKLGLSKALLKRNVNMGVNRSNSKGDSATMKPSRQRKKPEGIITGAAYRKWEKAAIAGVSLVADAAEHLERTGTVKEVENDREIPGEKCSDPVSNILPTLPTFPRDPFVDNSINNSMKLKLQLFPIDDHTRRALEMDKHNPFLELTLSTRKKISSILEHLNHKWGNSSIAIGELMLLPYSVQRANNLITCQKWTQESTLSAADVYAMIGSPPVFRLRYGWFSKTELGSLNMQAPIASSCMYQESNINIGNMNCHIVDSAPLSEASANNHSMDLHEDRVTSVTRNPAVTPTSTDVPNARNDSIYLNPRLEESCEPIPILTWPGKDDGDGNMTQKIEDKDELRLSNGTGLSSGEWADSLTNISIGDLLSGVSQDLDVDCSDQPMSEDCQDLQIPFSSDSFDAAIAAHISRHQDKMGNQPTWATHTSSIWDAEETCDAFLFRKNSISHEDGPCLSPITSAESHEQATGISSECFVELAKQLLPEEDSLVDNIAQTEPTDDCQSNADNRDHSAKDFSMLGDMYWPDSLGPLDLDIPSTKYHSDGLILSDSLSGLNLLIASSLDAFQNCSFFGYDKKEASSMVEARETTPFSDFKVGSGI